MDWMTTAKFLKAFAFLAGAAFGVLNHVTPYLRPGWWPETVVMVGGLSVYPLIIFGIIRFNLFINSGIEVVPPRLDRCFVSFSRPLDTCLLSAHLSYWAGAGLLLTAFLCWPYNLILAASMFLGYYSICGGIWLCLNARVPKSAGDIE